MATSSPSPASLLTTSDGTARSPRSLRYKEEDPADALERIFTPETFDKFRWVEELPDQSFFTKAFRFIMKQARKQYPDDTPSANTLLHHYGIRTASDRGGLGHRLGKLGRFVFRMFFTPSTWKDHLRNIESLARAYCEGNPDGGSGYSFGAMLDRYLFHHLVYGHKQQLFGAEASLIGGDRRYILDRDHETIHDQHIGGRPDGIPDTSVTLHLVRWEYLVRRGDEKVYKRVTKSLPELLGHELDPKFLYLCHGTTMAHASALVRGGPNLTGAPSSTDFGKAFYLTDAFEYAAFAGHLGLGGTPNTDTAVLVFPVPRAALNEGQILNLTTNNDDWQQVVCNCRTDKMKNIDLAAAHQEADCVIGPILGNASKIDQGEQAWPLDFQQWAFRSSHFLDEIFAEIIDNGKVHVFRLVH